MTDIEVVQDIYDAIATGDLPRIFEHLHADIVVTQDPALPWGGRHVGHDGFAEFGLALTANIDSKVTIDAIFEADGDVVQFGRTRGTTRVTGRAFDVAEVHRWTVQVGKAIRAHFSIDTAAMLAALEQDAT